ncbi:MAG: amidohydrolase [Deltaproteobacteria bacterium]|nr:amidohydrolase [Deltaproteobacteria bacterium]
MKELISSVFERCRNHFPDIVEIRRDLHMHPELGFEVQRTAGVVADELERIGLKVTRGVGKTGVVGDIDVPGAERRIALRADMDALAMEELGEIPYRSRIKGRAHMCGHDVHTAILLGAGRVLSEMKDRLKVSVRLVFQPSEESPPGGALAMVEDGVLEGVDEIFGLHVWPGLEAGHFGISPGAFLSQADRFRISIVGKGGHAAQPSFAIDPIVLGAQFVTLLQSVVSRNVDPLESAVVTVTRFHGGTADNIIPPEVTMTGTVRTLKSEVQTLVREKIQALLDGLTSTQGASHVFSYEEGYPVTFNNEQSVKRALSATRSLVGEDQVLFPQPPMMGSEDFGYFSREIPGCFINLGCANEKKGITARCHNPMFDVDEECMVYGMALEVLLALQFHLDPNDLAG